MNWAICLWHKLLRRCSIEVPKRLYATVQTTISRNYKSHPHKKPPETKAEVIPFARQPYQCPHLLSILINHSSAEQTVRWGRGLFALRRPRGFDNLSWPWLSWF